MNYKRRKKLFSKNERIGNRKKTKIKKNKKYINEELDFYKYVNNVLIDEHKQYYLNILKNGYNTKTEGLIWVVRNLLEL